jgi:sulfide dehydrogenase [flavocytochrome c] flavoprotein chain
MLASGSTIGYDKLVLSPGIDLMWDGVEGLKAASESGRILPSWRAGPETLALRRQLEAMRDSGTFAIVIPEAPYRCPPGPDERASVMAACFKAAKPKMRRPASCGSRCRTTRRPTCSTCCRRCAPA